MQWLALLALLPCALQVASHPTNGGHDHLHARTSSIAPGPSDPQIQFAPVPATAVGVTIDPTLGYFVEHLGHGTYWITDGFYSSMFLVGDKSVIVADAPPTIGRKLLSAIGNITHLPVKHFIYSHMHADHAGGAFLFESTAEFIAQEETLALLKQLPTPDPLRPLPTKTFKNSFTLVAGNQTVELVYKGPNHLAGNIFIHVPASRIVMFIDVIFPGWIPFSELAVSSDIPGWTAAHDQLLEFDFVKFIPGHVTRLGTRQDVIVQKEYLTDLFNNCKAAINGGFNVTDAVGPTILANPGNPWAEFKAYLRVAAETCAVQTNTKWLGKLGAIDVFGWENAYKMIESLRIDYDVLGPFGVSD